MGVYNRSRVLSGKEEVIFMVVPVWQWMAKSFQSAAVDSIRHVFKEMASSDEIHQHVQYWISQTYEQFKSQSFREAIPGKLEMGLGGWVERELRIAMHARLSMVQQRAAWSGFGFALKVRVVMEVLIDTYMRCGLVRGCAYHGLKPAPEEPLIIKDERGIAHRFDIQLAQPVTSYGRGASELG